MAMVGGYCNGSSWILWRWWVDTVAVVELPSGYCGGGG